jgi:hypothetical protein
MLPSEKRNNEVSAVWEVTRRILRQVATYGRMCVGHAKSTRTNAVALWQVLHYALEQQEKK